MKINTSEKIIRKITDKMFLIIYYENRNKTKLNCIDIDIGEDEEQIMGRAYRTWGDTIPPYFDVFNIKNMINDKKNKKIAKELRKLINEGDEE